VMPKVPLTFSKAWWHGCERAMDEFVADLDRGL